MECASAQVAVKVVRPVARLDDRGDVQHADRTAPRHQSFPEPLEQRGR